MTTATTTNSAYAADATYPRTVLIRARAWTGARIENVVVRVDEDGACRVYDPIGQHWTVCHDLSAGAQRRAQKLAAAFVRGASILDKWHAAAR